MRPEAKFMKQGGVVIPELSTESFTREEIRIFRQFYVEKRIKLLRNREEIDQDLIRIGKLIELLNV